MSGAWASPCPHPRPGGHRCKSRRCPSCGVLWAGDTRKRLLVNVAHYGGNVALLTITGPGAAVLPDREAKIRWNGTAPARWRALHRAASQTARRRHGRLTVLAWTWEYQRRGVLHKHIVCGLDSAREQAAAHTYALELERLGGSYGFGFVSDSGRGPTWRRRGLQQIAAERASRYVAKYLSPLDSTGKPSMSETVTHVDVPPLVAYVSRALTLQTGCTMRFLRHVRFCWVLGIDPRTGEVLRPSLIVSEPATDAPTRGP